jgi:hypothetical protein
MDIVSIALGKPDETNIIGSSTPFDMAGLGVGFAVHTFNFPAPVALSAGTQYAFILRNIAPGANSWALEEDSGGDPYAGGFRYSTVDGGANWTDFSTSDLRFEIRGTELTGGTFKYEIFEQALILDNLEENAFVNEASILELDDGTTRDRVGQPFALTQDRAVLVRKTVRLKRIGDPLGNTFVGVFRDDGAGNPDLSKQLFETKFDNVLDLVAGDNDLEITLPCIGLSADTYHWVVRTDAAYKASFVTTVDSVQVATADSPFDPGILSARTYNGAVWADTGTKAAVFLIEGRDLKLILKVGNTIANASLSAFGVAYDVQAGEITTKSLPLDFFTFNGAEDKQRFLLSFKPDPNFVEFHVGVDGQTFRHGDFNIDGNELVFDAGSFLSPGEVFVVQVDQLKKMGNNFIDDNPRLINLLRDNFLASTIPGYDFGRNGRSTKSRADDGLIFEKQVTSVIGPFGRAIRVKEIL